MHLHEITDLALWIKHCIASTFLNLYQDQKCGTVKRNWAIQLQRKAANTAFILATDHVIASYVLKPRDCLLSSHFVVYNKMIATCCGNAVVAEAQQHGQRMTGCSKCQVQRANKQSPADQILMYLVISHHALDMDLMSPSSFILVENKAIWRRRSVEYRLVLNKSKFRCALP